MTSLAGLWNWVLWGAVEMQPVQPYAIVGTFVGMVWNTWNMWRIRHGWRVVRIVAVETDSKERRHIADVPWQFVTRAEVQGLVANAAKGERLDFGQFQFDYAFQRELIVNLPPDSFRKLRTP